MKVKFLCGSSGIAMSFGHPLRVVFQTCCVILFLLPVVLAHAAKVEDFIPQESVVYLQLQDIDEVYGEIEMSDNWEKAFALLPEESGLQEMQQGILMAEGVLGTDLLSVIETVGYRTAFAVWLDELGEPQIGLVIHSGGNLGELQRFTKIVEGLLGMDESNTLRLNAGVYQRVQYNALEMDRYVVKYGFVDECLVLGGGEGSFEKLMDTYRKGVPSLQQNEKFARAVKKMGTGEVTVFADMEFALSLMNDLDEWGRTRLPIFQSVFGRLNLLETGPFLQVAVQFNPHLPENEIGLFLREGEQLETLNALSGNEDLFVAVAPHILESVWQLARTELERDATDDVYAVISLLEGLLNLNLEEDIMTGLTGELALAVPDFTHFDPQGIDNINLQFVEGTFELDAEGVETNGGIVFNPSDRMKWTQLGNSLSNLQNASISQTVYNKTTISEFATNIYYGEADGLFLFSFSEEQMHALVDGIQQKKKPSYLKAVPKIPVMFAQLNVARFLEIESGVAPADRVFVSSKEVAPFLGWVSVEGGEALLEVTLSEKETPVEAFAKLVPFFLWNMEAR